MTTFTITCQPTVAGTTQLTSNTGSRVGFYVEEVDGSIASESYNASALFISANDISSNAFTSDNQSRFESDFYPEDPGGGNAYFWTDIGATSRGRSTTQSWDGGRTEVTNDSFGITYNDGSEQITNTQINTTIVWSSFQDTSSKTTTTQTNTVYLTTFRETTNVTTRSGTTVQTGTMTAPDPRTTVTQTQGFTTKTDNLSTTRITTTTQQDNFGKWRTGSGGATHRGTFQSATVVCLETSNLGNLRPELAWVVTQRPAFTATSSGVVQQQTTTQFTVFPSFVPTAGHVEQGTHTDYEGFTFSTSSEVIETPTTYKTTTSTANTLTVASQFTALPSPLSEQSAGSNATTITTQDWFSTIHKALYTGGDTSTTTIFSTTTHQGRIGNVTWNETHRRSTTALTNFDLLTAYTFSQTTTLDVQTNGYSYTGGNSETKTLTFSRPVPVLADIHAPFATQNQCGSSLSFAVAAASNATSVAQEMGAVGVSVRGPSLVDIARTARAPLGSWAYVTAGTSISASAGPASLSVTSAFGNPITTESTEGAWTLAGDAVSRANLPFGHRINLGGTPPTGTATAFYDAGIFSTSNSNASGTIEVMEARTEIIDSTAARTAYLRATGVFIGGEQRYNTTRRNITQTISESAIITERSQLIL